MCQERYELERLLVEQSMTAAQWRLGSDSAMPSVTHRERVANDLDGVLRLMDDNTRISKVEEKRLIRRRIEIEEALLDIMMVMEKVHGR